MNLINYIRVLGDDCMVTIQDTYDFTVAQLKLKIPGVELVTEGIGPLHSIEDGPVVSLGLEEGSGVGELPNQEVHIDEAV